MKFDVVVGNPPYQNGDNSHFYKQFISLAKRRANTVALVIPCSYFNNLDFFADISHYCYNGKNFTNVDLATSWFIWQRHYRKSCKIFINKECVIVDKIATPPLNNVYMFNFINDMKLRHVTCYTIKGGKLLRKDAITDDDGIDCIWSCGGNRDEFDKSKISPNQIEKTSGFGRHKVVVSEAYGGYFKQGDNIYNRLGGIKYADPQHSCAAGARYIETLSKIQSENLISYLETKFVKAIVGNVKNTFHNTSQVFSCIPVIDTNKKWSDSELYKHFDLSEELILYIETTF